MPRPTSPSRALLFLLALPTGCTRTTRSRDRVPPPPIVVAEPAPGTVVTPLVDAATLDSDAEPDEPEPVPDLTLGPHFDPALTVRSEPNAGTLGELIGCDGSQGHDVYLTHSRNTKLVVRLTEEMHSLRLWARSEAPVMVSIGSRLLDPVCAVGVHDAVTTLRDLPRGTYYVSVGSGQGARAPVVFGLLPEGAVIPSTPAPPIPLIAADEARARWNVRAVRPSGYGPTLFSVRLEITGAVRRSVTVRGPIVGPCLVAAGDLPTYECSGGGTDRVSVRRGRTPDAYEIQSSAVTDGACANDAGEIGECPATIRVLGRFTLPPNVRLTADPGPADEFVDL